MAENIITLEKLRDELVKNALQLRRGEVKPIVANAISNSLRGAVYAESARIQRDKDKPIEPETVKYELSDASKAKMDEIIKMLAQKGVKDEPEDNRV